MSQATDVVGLELRVGSEKVEQASQRLDTLEKNSTKAASATEKLRQSFTATDTASAKLQADLLRMQKTLEAMERTLAASHGELTKFNSTVQRLEQSVNSNTRAMAAYQTASAKMGFGLKNVLGLLGGPLLISMGAASAALALFAEQQSHAEKTAAKYGISLSGLDSQYNKLVAAMEKAAKAQDKLDRAQRESIARVSKMRQDALQKEITDLEGAIGGSRDTAKLDAFGNILGAYSFSMQSIKDFNNEVQKLVDLQRYGRRSLEETAITLGAFRQQLETLKKASQSAKEREEADKLLKTVGLLEGIYGKLIAKWKEHKEASDAYAAATGQADGATKKLSDSLMGLAEAQRQVSSLDKLFNSSALSASESSVKALAKELETVREAINVIGDDSKRAMAMFQASVLESGALAGGFNSLESFAKAREDLSKRLQQIEMGESEYRKWAAQQRYDSLKAALGAMRDAAQAQIELEEFKLAQLRVLKAEEIALITANIHAAETTISNTSKLITSMEANKKGLLASFGGRRSGSSSATRLKEEIEAVQAAIESLRKQMSMPIDDALGRDMLKVEEKFLKAVKEATREKDKQLKALKLEKAELQKVVETQEAQRKEQERQNQLLDNAFNFYRELETLSGQYGLSLQLQNDHLERQADNLRKNKNIVEEHIQQWLELQKLQLATDPESGIERATRKYLAEAQDLGKAYESTFSSLFSGLDNSFKSVWQNIFEHGKLTLDSFKSVFVNFLSEIAHYALTRPIVISIAGALSGALGLGGGSTAYAGLGGVAGSGGGVGNLLGSVPVTSILPDSWTSGISSFLSTSLPGTGGLIGSASYVAPTSYSAAGLAGSGFNLSGVTGAALNVPIGTALGYGALGGLGYSALGGLIGLPQSKYSGMTASLGGALGAYGSGALGGALGVTAGSTLGSVVPVVGTALGAILGGLAGSLFGDKKPDRPAVRTDVRVTLADPTGLAGYNLSDLASHKDQKFKITSQTDQYAIASTGRNKAGDEAAEYMEAAIKEAVEQSAARVQAIQQALPQEYADQLTAQLNNLPIETNWSFAFKDEEQFKRRVEQSVQNYWDIFDATMMHALWETDFSGLAGKIDVDRSSVEAFERIVQAFALIDETEAAIRELESPTSDWVKQAKAAIEQMEAWESAMRETGVTAEYSAQLMDRYRTATVDQMVRNFSDAIMPMNQLSAALEEQDRQVQGWIEALRMLGATEQQLIEAERLRAKAMEQTRLAMLQPFYDDMRVRSLTVAGGDVTGLRLEIQHRDELEKIIAQFGEGSHEQSILKAVQEAERLQHQADLAQAAADSAQSSYQQLTSQLEGLTASVHSAAEAVEAARLALVRELIANLDNARNGIKTAIDAWVAGTESTFNSALKAYASAIEAHKAAYESLAERMRQLQSELWTQTPQNSPLNAYTSSRVNLDDLYSKVMAGDTNAANSFAAAAKEFLDLSYDTRGTDREYYTDFDAVQKMLREVREEAERQAGMAETELDVLRKQFDLQQESQKTLEQLKAELMVSHALMEKAREEQKAAYERWGFESVSPDLEALRLSSEDIKKMYERWGFDAVVPELEALKGSSDALNALGEAQNKLYERWSLEGVVPGLEDLHAVNDLLRAAQEAQNRLQEQWKLEGVVPDLEYLKSANDALAAAQEVQTRLQEQLIGGGVIPGLESLKTSSEALRAASEAQKSLYDKWGLEGVVPGLEALRLSSDSLLSGILPSIANLEQAFLAAAPDLSPLEMAYRESVELWVKADKEMNDAILAGITTQSEIATLRIESKLDELRAALGAAKNTQTSTSQQAASTAAQQAAAAAAAAAAQAAADAAAKAAAEAAQKALEKVTTPKPNFAGSKFATEMELLSAKASEMNAGRTLGPGQTAGGWTASKVKGEILGPGNFKTVEEWYKTYGYLEGFASGGTVGRSGLAMVGEYGPELAYLPKATKIYDSETTRSLMDALAPEMWADEPRDRGLASGGGRNDAAVIASLQQQVALLQEQISLLSGILTHLGFVRGHTRQTVDRLDEMTNAQMLAQTGAMPIQRTDFED